MADVYSHAQFEPHVGSAFTAVNVDADGGHSITLVSATTDDPQPDAPRSDPFTLLFEGSTDACLPQATYVLQHESLGEVTMFLVPIGPDDDSGKMRYEAVFN